MMHAAITPIAFVDPDAPSNAQTYSMGVYGGHLFFGTRNHDHGSRLFRMDSEGRIDTALAMNPENIDIYGLVEYRERLYFGTYNRDGGELHRMDRHGAVERLFDGGLDTPHNQDIWSLREHCGRLYFGTWNNHDGGKIYVADDGEDFRRIHDEGCPASNYIRSLNELDGMLYASLGHKCVPQRLLRIDGDLVTSIDTPMGDPRTDAYCGCVFNGRLYLAVAAYHRNDELGGVEVWSFDGTDWVPCASGGFGNPDNLYALAMAVYNGRLVCATYNYATGCELWASPDGVEWLCVADCGFGLGGDNESILYSLHPFGDSLIMGTRNVKSGFKLYRLQADW